MVKPKQTAAGRRRPPHSLIQQHSPGDAKPSPAKANDISHADPIDPDFQIYNGEGRGPSKGDNQTVFSTAAVIPPPKARPAQPLFHHCRLSCVEISGGFCLQVCQQTVRLCAKLDWHANLVFEVSCCNKIEIKQHGLFLFLCPFAFRGFDITGALHHNFFSMKNAICLHARLSQNGCSELKWLEMSAV